MEPQLGELRMTHLNLDARDLQATWRCYRELLGLTFHFGFRVAEAGDVDGWIDRLRDYSVPIIVEPKHAGSVYVARVGDPDGYEIEI